MTHAINAYLSNSVPGCFFLTKVLQYNNVRPDLKLDFFQLLSKIDSTSLTFLP